MAEDMNKLVVAQKGEHGILYTNGLILISGGRLTYPFVQGQTNTNDDGKDVESWSSGMLVPKSTHRWIKDICVSEINRLLKENKLTKLAAERKFIKDGNNSDKDGYEDMWVISARSYEPIILYGNKKGRDGKIEKITGSGNIKRLFYGGANGALMIRPWFQDHKKYGKRVNAALVAAQFQGHNDAFGEGRINEDAIDDGGWDVTEADDLGGNDDQDDL